MPDLLPAHSSAPAGNRCSDAGFRSQSIGRFGPSRGLSQFHLRFLQSRSGRARLRHYGRTRPATAGENVDLVYSRFNHPNAEFWKTRYLPLEPGAQAAAVFNSGMAAIMTALLAVLKPGDSVVYTVPIYGGTQTLIQSFSSLSGFEAWPVSRAARAKRSMRRFARRGICG